MRIYNFTSFPHAISNLKNKRLKISRFNELNDPFELLAADLLDIRHREAFTRFKKQLNEKAGIVCFSGAWGNPLIWGHYAKRHTGIALGFDVSDEMLLKVHYTASRPKIEFDQTKRKVVDGSKVVDQLIRTKFIDWKYEDEYRMYVNLNTSQSELSLNFVNFSEDLVLREVILGMNCQTSMVNILKLINSDSKVRVLKAGMAKRSFKIIEDRSFRHATNL